MLRSSVPDKRYSVPPFRRSERSSVPPFQRLERSSVPPFLRSDLMNGMNGKERIRTKKNDRSIPFIFFDRPFISVHERVPNPAAKNLILQDPDTDSELESGFYNQILNPDSKSRFPFRIPDLDSERLLDLDPIKIRI